MSWHLVKIFSLSPQTFLGMSWLLIRRFCWFHSHRCWNAVLNSGLWRHHHWCHILFWFWMRNKCFSELCVWIWCSAYEWSEAVCVNASSMSVLKRQKLNPLLSAVSARRRVTLRRPGIVLAQRRADAQKTDPQPEPLWICECYMTCSYERPLLYGAGRTKLLRLHVETEILIVFVRVGLIVGAACYHGKQTRLKDRQLTCRPLHDESLNNSHTLWGWLCFWVENQIFIFCKRKTLPHSWCNPTMWLRGNKAFVGWWTMYF